MSTPFTVLGTLNFPPDTTLPADPLPFGVSGSYDSVVEAVFKAAAAGTKSVDMGTITKAKALLVKVDSGQSVQPVLITINGGSEPIEISAGGFVCLGSPSPDDDGITSVSLEYNSACVVRVWILG